MYLSAFLSRSRSGSPRASSPTPTLSITVSHGKRAKDWNTIAVPGFTPFSGRAPTPGDRAARLQVLAEDHRVPARAPCRHAAGDQAGQDRGHEDPPEVAPAAQPEGEGGLLHFLGDRGRRADDVEQHVPEHRGQG